jgi:hypothetical protein
MADALTQDVIKLVVSLPRRPALAWSGPTLLLFPAHCTLQSSTAARPLLKKRASLALLRLIRKTSAEQHVSAPGGAGAGQPR